jgi:sigma-B regulation protein RsbU (phosphoserine phosphatase)
MFVTMVYAIIDDNNRTVQFTNAGHAHPFIIHPDKSEVSLIEGGCFLGIDDQMEYEVGETTMKPGSVLVLYTDGVPDATNEEKQQFGLERFKTVVRDQLENSSQDILDNIYQATLSFRGTAEQFDDFTLIILKCLK